MKFTYASGDRPLEGYTIKRGVGRGGFGEVYQAMSDGGKEVALKHVQRNLEVELRGVGQCLNLKHPNLVNLHDLKQGATGDYWVVMEYVAGETLDALIARIADGLPQEEALAWLKGICDGVAHLHAQGLVHRDLKPGNVFREESVVKVGDYGLSKFISTSRRSGQTGSVGTVHYMAPEIAHGRYGKEVDLYAIGIILYEMLTGRVPFDGTSPGEILMKHMTATPDLSPLPPAFRPVVARLLNKDPHQRYSSVQAMMADLTGYLAAPPIETDVQGLATYATPRSEIHQGIRGPSIPVTEQDGAPSALQGSKVSIIRRLVQLIMVAGFATGVGMLIYGIGAYHAYSARSNVSDRDLPAMVMGLGAAMVTLSVLLLWFFRGTTRAPVSRLGKADSPFTDTPRTPFHTRAGAEPAVSGESVHSGSASGNLASTSTDFTRLFAATATSLIYWALMGMCVAAGAGLFMYAARTQTSDKNLSNLTGSLGVAVLYFAGVLALPLLVGVIQLWVYFRRNTAQRRKASVSTSAATLVHRPMWVVKLGFVSGASFAVMGILLLFESLRRPPPEAVPLILVGTVLIIFGGLIAFVSFRLWMTSSGRRGQAIHGDHGEPPSDRDSVSPGDELARTGPWQPPVQNP